MAGAKTILINPHTGEGHEFDADHAARIMALPNNGGWAYKEEPKAGPKTKKKAKDAGRTVRIAGEATSATEPEEDCGCH